MGDIDEKHDRGRFVKAGVKTNTPHMHKLYSAS